MPASEDSWIKEAWAWFEKHGENAIMIVGKTPTEKRFWRMYEGFMRLIWECKVKGIMALPPEFEKYKDMPEFKELLKIWGITLEK